LKRKKHAEQGIEHFKQALAIAPTVFKRKMLKDRVELIDEYLATLHLLAGEIDFIDHNTLRATEHFSDALDVNRRATPNHARPKREVFARERLATIAARIGKYDSAIIHIANALDIARKGDKENYPEVLQVAIAIYSKLGDTKTVAKFQKQLDKLLPSQQQAQPPAKIEGETAPERMGPMDQIGPVEWAGEPGEPDAGGPETDDEEGKESAPKSDSDL
jgi:tetratricopeptide (TPR) repeat protein